MDRVWDVEEGERWGGMEGGMYLHVDLHGRRFDVFEDVGAVSGVVAVEPGAGCRDISSLSFTPRWKHV